MAGVCWGPDVCESEDVTRFDLAFEEEGRGEPRVQCGQRSGVVWCPAMAGVRVPAEDVPEPLWGCGTGAITGWGCRERVPETQVGPGLVH